MAITLRTVIGELQFASALSIDSPNDPRLKPLLKAAVADLKAAVKDLGGDPGDDPGIGS